MCIAIQSWVLGFSLGLTAISGISAPVEVTSIAGVRAIKTTIELAGMNTWVRSVAIGPASNTLYLLIDSRPDGMGMSTARPSTIFKDNGGNISVISMPQTVPVAEGASQTQSTTTLASTSHLATDTLGKPYLLTMALSGATQLHKLSENGPLGEGMPVAIGLPSLTIRRFKAVGDRGFLIVGASGLRPAIVHIDAFGRVLQRIVLAEEGAAIAALLAPGNEIAVLVENTDANIPQSWIGRVRTDGSIGVRSKLAGKPLDFEMGIEGNYAVLLEQLSGSRYDILIKGFNREFKEQWSRTAVTGQAISRGFKVAGLRDGGYLLEGRRDRGLWLSRVNIKGEEMWSSWTDPSKMTDLETTVNVDLATSNNAIAVAYSALIVRERKQYGVTRTLQFVID